MTFKGMNIGDSATLTQVEIYVCEKGYTFEPVDFFNKYERKGWKTLKGQPLKSLEIAIDAYNGNFTQKEVKRQKREYFKQIKKEKKETKRKLKDIKTENKKHGPFADYADQLSDPRWRAFRQFVFAVRGKECEMCGSKNFLQVHHLEYKKGYKAWEYTCNDVIIVCGGCHKKIHNIR